MRHALTKFPDCNFMWYLDQHAYIMDPTKSLEAQVLAPKALERLMIKDEPVVPPDSIIKTFEYLTGSEADLIISQDKDGLVSDSLVLRNGDWAKFFAETWFDPLYRGYNFQKAERHALVSLVASLRGKPANAVQEHIVQWHPTILSKLALVPQRTLAGYSSSALGTAYEDGDFVVMFPGCTRAGQKSCETEASTYWQTWKDAFGAE